MTFYAIAEERSETFAGEALHNACVLVGDFDNVHDAKSELMTHRFQICQDCKKHPAGKTDSPMLVMRLSRSGEEASRRANKKAGM